MTISVAADPYGGNCALRVSDPDPVYSFAASSAIPAGVSGFTVSFWAKCSSGTTSGYASIIGRDVDDYFFGFNLSNKTLDHQVSVFVNYGSALLADLVKDAWNHICFTWEGTSAKLYVNGSLSFTQTAYDLSNYWDELVSVPQFKNYYNAVGEYFDIFDYFIVSQALPPEVISWYYADRLTNGANSLPPGA